MKLAMLFVALFVSVCIALDPLSITNGTLPDGTVGSAYSATLAGTGGVPPYSWALISGSLPAGLVLNGVTGQITGTPTTAATSTFTIRLKDASQATSTLTITIAPSTPPPPPAGTVLWVGDFETGNKSQWTAQSGGGEYNSGTASSLVETDHRHSGAYGLSMTISGNSGVRFFRWKEARSSGTTFVNGYPVYDSSIPCADTTKGCYYTEWVFIPVKYSFSSYWNLFQIKSRTSDGSRIDPIWGVYMDPATGRLQLGWGWGGTQLAGPHQGDPTTGKWFRHNGATAPIGKWFQIQMLVKPSKNYDGQVTLWQDGVLLLDMPNVITSYPNCHYNPFCTDTEWSVNNYSSGLSPSPATIYADDCRVSTAFMFP